MAMGVSTPYSPTTSSISTPRNRARSADREIPRRADNLTTRQISRRRHAVTALDHPKATSTAIPRIVSVDDHVVEPAHLWNTWLPARFRDAGPKVERRGIGSMRHVGGGSYEQTFDADGPPAD